MRYREGAGHLHRHVKRLVQTELAACHPLAERSSFYELGGDSLLASQLAGLLVEQLLEARPVSYNSVLRVLLEGPSVMALAARLRDGP